MRTLLVLSLLLLATACGSDADTPAAAPRSTPAVAEAPTPPAEPSPRTPAPTSTDDPQDADDEPTPAPPDSAIASDDARAPSPSDSATGSDAEAAPEPSEPPSQPSATDPADNPQGGGSEGGASAGGGGSEGGGSSTQPGSSAVTIVDFEYQPEALTVPAGTTIVWTNTDVAGHTVTADDGTTFASGEITPEGNFSVTLDEPGTYTYHCEFHPYMEATIEVSG